MTGHPLVALNGSTCFRSEIPVASAAKYCYYPAMTFRLILVASLFACLPLRAQEAAQPPLPAVSLRVGARSVSAEVADNDAARACGLMFRESLAADAGMLFVMPSVGPVGFWMKNTKIPLSIAYIDPQGTIVEIHDMDPRSEKVVRSVFPRIAYALEMPCGWFAKNGVWPGEQISGLPEPSRLRKEF